MRSIVLIGFGMVSLAGNLAGQDEALSRVAEAARVDWYSHDSKGLMEPAVQGILLQLPGADPSAPVSQAQGAALLKEYLAGSDPNDPASRALLASELTVEGTMATLRLSLPDPLVGQDGTLDTGCWQLPLEVQVSSNLVDWSPVGEVGMLTVGGFLLATTSAVLVNYSEFGVL